MADEYITTVTDTHIVVTLPPAPPPSGVSWLLAKLRFKLRFPAEKWKAARAASAADADLADFFEDFDLAKHIDLKDPRTMAGVTGMTAAAVPATFRLTEAERAAILDVPCQPGEEP